MQLRNNYFFVRPGQPALLVSSNFTNYLEIGNPTGPGFYLIAQVEDGEFVVSGRLFDSMGRRVCEIDRNHARTSEAVIEYLKPGGYEVRWRDGDLVFALQRSAENPHVGVLRGRFYNERGELVAEGDESDFRLYRGPAIVGKSNGTYGLVIEPARTTPLPS
ncbi:MAG TPA: hypothetical protein VNM91_09185 [Dehalococcoidia bacterium]|nr:hypothetical protein [Dehalococcoidia bacterium]